MSFRIGKCWQCQPSGMVWQVKSDHFKGFFVVYAEGYWEFTEAKPEHLVNQGHFVNLARKYMYSRVGRAYVKDGDLEWFGFGTYSDDQIHHWVRLDHKNKELSLILKDGEQIVRLTPEKTFTNKKNLTDLPDVFSGWNISHTKLDKMLASGEIESESISKYQNQIRKKLKRKKKTLKQSLAKAEKTIVSPQELSFQQEQTQMLQAFAWKITPVMETLELSQDETGNQSYSISLDFPGNPGKSIQSRFMRLKKSVKANEIGQKRVAEMSQQLDMLEVVLQQLEFSCDHSVLQEVEQRYQLNTSQRRNPHKSSQKVLRVFESSDGVTMVVGRNAEENDLLTSQARSVDWWFHTVDGQGSHVVVKGVKNQELSAQTVFEAKMLAIHFSSRRRDQEGEVYVVRRLHLKKSRTVKGRWDVGLGSNQYVKYTDMDLSKILSSFVTKGQS